MGSIGRLLSRMFRADQAASVVPGVRNDQALARGQEPPSETQSFEGHEAVRNGAGRSAGAEQAQPLNPVGGVAAPAFKTQAMEDAEVVNSDAWWADVEEGKRAWEHQLVQLRLKVSTLQADGNAVFLMVLVSYFDLPGLDAQSVLDPALPDQLQQKIEERFGLHEYQRVIDEKTVTRWNSYPRSVDWYMGEFVMQRWRYLEGANRFVELIAENLDTVEAHFQDLARAERIHNPMAGGVKLSAWRGFTRKFAKEHLRGVAPEDFFPAPVPRYIRDYRAEEMGVASGRYLWALMATVAALSQPGSRSTFEVGVAFEERLIDEISEAFPTARVQRTPTTGDQGADLVLQIEGIKIVIQAKRYTGVVGNAAVQEVYAAMGYYGADFAMVVTTSRYTQAASNLAVKVGVELATAEDYLRRLRQLLV